MILSFLLSQEQSFLEAPELLCRKQRRSIPPDCEQEGIW